MGRVEGKVALVTGAASGLGKADAEGLVAEGARVLLTDLDTAAGEAAAKSLGDAAHFAAHDVSDEGSWQNAIAEAEDRFGALDIVVNNAGIVAIGSVEDTTLEQWERIMSVNARGVFLGCKYGVAAMKERGGSIINLSSVAALMGTPAFFAYSASKGAVRSLTKSVAVHCRIRDYKIRCNSIHPGGMQTSMVTGLADDPGASANADLLASMRPEKGMGSPRDVADMVVYLASDESQRVSGAEFVIDDAYSVA